MRAKCFLSPKAVAVVLTAGVALGAAGGTASAATSAAKQYKSIVAPVNKIVQQENSPKVSDLRSAFSKAEKRFSAAHWPGKSAKDVKLLVKDMKGTEPMLEKVATTSNFNPTRAQALKLEGLFKQIEKVRKDVGLSSTTDLSNVQGF